MKVYRKGIFIFAGVLFAAIALISVHVCVASFSSKDQIHYIYISDGDNIDTVCSQLDSISSPLSMAEFKLLSSLYGYSSNIRTGRYAVKHGESTLTVWRHMKNGLQSSVNLTIPEVRTMERLAGFLSKTMMLDSASVADNLRDSLFCARYGYDTCTIAAMFIPNTYNIYWNTSLDKFMERMKKEHERFWESDGRIAKAQALGLTETEVATIASIIDEETANNAEKPMVAGMYCNRLRIGMPLQADPTIKFALKDFALRRIYKKLLTVDSPYNTYVNEGLPPGPIKIASIAGIDAVLNQVKHDYLYMCAKEDFSGTHNFAVTYQEHLRNAAKYSKALNERGIK